MKKYIVLEGVDGCGKNTIGKALSVRLGGLFFDESDINGNYLDNSFTDFERQVIYMANRILFFNNVLSKTDKPVISARSYVSAMIYSSEFNKSIIQNILKRINLIQPSIFVYLRCSLDVLVGRLKKRDGVCFTVDDEQALSDLISKYDQWALFNNECSAPILTVACDNFTICETVDYLCKKFAELRI